MEQNGCKYGQIATSTISSFMAANDSGAAATGKHHFSRSSLPDFWAKAGLRREWFTCEAIEALGVIASQSQSAAVAPRAAQAATAKGAARGANVQKSLRIGPVCSRGIDATGVSHRSEEHIRGKRFPARRICRQSVRDTRRVDVAASIRQNAPNVVQRSVTSTAVARKNHESTKYENAKTTKREEELDWVPAVNGQGRRLDRSRIPVG